MKKFVWRITLFTFLLLVSFYFVLIQADGYETFYKRFTTPQQSSLILGTSRAAHAIQPKYLNKILSRNDFFNYAFTGSQSPYGYTYLKSIEKKLYANTRSGIFILSVDPWSISSYCEVLSDSEKFREQELILGTTLSVNENPNFHYLINSYDKPYYNLLLKSNTFLHDDGWLEVTVSMDSAVVERRTKSKIVEYKKISKLYRYISQRLYYLKKTIGFLSQHGKVFLIRLPVDPQVMEIDQVIVPDFTEKIKKISKETNTPYLDLTYMNSKLLYLDGSHIYKESGRIVTEIIANWILEQNLKIN